MNILLVVIPHRSRVETSESLITNVIFPLGPGYVVAAIRDSFPEANIKVLSLDFGDGREESIEHELNHIKKNFSPDFILYGTMITRYTYVIALSNKLREAFPNSVQVFGGSGATWGHEYFFGEASIDVIVCGEAEESIVEILKGDIASSAGACGPVVVNAMPGKQNIRDINAIPIPSHKDFPIDKYIGSSVKRTGWRTMTMTAGRGCPFACAFCSPSGRKLRIRNVDNVVEEMSMLKMDYGVDSLVIMDELQFADKKWFEEFCSTLIRKRLGLKWLVTTRATLVQKKDLPLLKLARKAGLVRVPIGIESGSEKMLAAMNKGTSVEQMENAIRIIRKAGIKANGGMLVGLPGENPETVQESIDFAKRNLIETSFSNLIPLPGAPIWDYCLDNKKITDVKQYLRHVSELGGNANIVAINLTDMDDEKYKSEINRANAEMTKTRIIDIYRYYGPLNGIFKIIEKMYFVVLLKITGRQFETP